MRYAIKYLLLADFFLEKRTVEQDGVEGYDKNFTFSEKELKAKGLGKKETIDMLKILKTETVWPKDEDGEKHEKTVIKKYNEKGGNKIEIIDCTTDKLQRFKKKISGKIRRSVIEVNQKNKTIKYGNRSMKFYNARRWDIFCYLHRNYPDMKSYENMWLATFELPIAGTPPFKTIKKDVQNVINGTQKRMTLKGFPKDAIDPTENKGYRLTI